MFERNADLTIKPTNIIQGISQGSRIFIKNVGRGITSKLNSLTNSLLLNNRAFLLDLVHKPITEAKKDGIAGFFTGMAKGVGGMIVSPLSGVFDAGTKALEGLKNTANIFGKSANTTRIRNPRVFYGTEKAIKEFNKISSHSFYILNKILKDSTYEDLTFLGAFKITSGESKSDAQEILIVTLEWIICLDYAKESVIWKVKPSDILKTVFKETAIELQLASPIKLKSSGTTNKLVFKARNLRANKNMASRIDITKFAF